VFANLGRNLSELSGTWMLDPAHTSVEIAVRHMMVATVRGRLRPLRGELRLDAEDPYKSFVDVELDAASVDTGNADRDKHLRSADFLDAEEYPTIGFHSTEVRDEGDGTYVIIGDLTLKNETRPMTLVTEVGGVIRDPYGNDRIGFSATGSVDRSEFGLTWNAAMEGGGLVLGDRLKINIDAEFTRQPGS
jgi:polyisoprenoid-binding protein YceI